jgi:hypothetical protein
MKKTTLTTGIVVLSIAATVIMYAVTSGNE